jgi:hypothetical protein
MGRLDERKQIGCCRMESSGNGGPDEGVVGGGSISGSIVVWIGRFKSCRLPCLCPRTKESKEQSKHSSAVQLAPQCFDRPNRSTGGSSRHGGRVIDTTDAKNQRDAHQCQGKRCNNVISVAHAPASSPLKRDIGGKDQQNHPTPLPFPHLFNVANYKKIEHKKKRT